MCCRITDLREKEVINIKDGCRLGCVCDVEVDTGCGKVVSLIIFGRGIFFGLFGRNDDIVICWDDIQVIGDDTILVCFEKNPLRSKKRKGIFANLFGSGR